MNVSPIATVCMDAGAGRPDMNQIPVPANASTTKDRKPTETVVAVSSPRKTPPNHITTKYGTTIPPKISPNSLVVELEPPSSVVEWVAVFGGMPRFASPVCCFAAFSRSPPLDMLIPYDDGPVMKQSPLWTRRRSFKEWGTPMGRHCHFHQSPRLHDPLSTTCECCCGKC